jgi:hypothetical protein
VCAKGFVACNQGFVNGSGRCFFDLSVSCVSNVDISFMSLLHVVFLKCSFLFRCSPSLPGGFHAADFQSFTRYCDCTETASVPLLLFASVRFGYLSAAWRASSTCRPCRPNMYHPDLLFTRLTVFPNIFDRRQEALPDSRSNPVYICPCRHFDLIIPFPAISTGVQQSREISPKHLALAFGSWNEIPPLRYQ